MGESSVAGEKVRRNNSPDTPDRSRQPRAFPHERVESGGRLEGGVTGDESRPRPLVGAPGVVAYPGNIGPPLARSGVRGAYTTGRHRYTDNDNDADRRPSSVLAFAVVAVGHGAHRRARDRVQFQGIPGVSLHSERDFPSRNRAKDIHTYVPAWTDSESQVPRSRLAERTIEILFPFPLIADYQWRDRNWKAWSNRSTGPHARFHRASNVDDSSTSDSGTVRILAEEGVSRVTTQKSGPANARKKIGNIRSQHAKWSSRGATNSIRGVSYRDRRALGAEEERSAGRKDEDVLTSEKRTFTPS